MSPTMRRMLVLMFLLFICASNGTDCATASSNSRDTAAVALPLLLLEPDVETILGAVMLRDRGARAVAEALRLSSTRTHTVTLLCGGKVA
jgi:hypothetical protein